MKQTALAVLLLGITLVWAPAAGPAPTGGIQVYAENPFYWEYQGKPVLLLGGSSAPKGGLNDEGMFLWPDVAGSLDKLASAGGNYTRCLMSGRLRGQPLWPFLNADGRFDLDRWTRTTGVASRAFWRRPRDAGSLPTSSCGPPLITRACPGPGTLSIQSIIAIIPLKRPAFPPRSTAIPVWPRMRFTSRCRTKEKSRRCSDINSALWIRSSLIRCSSTTFCTAWTMKPGAVLPGARIGLATSETPRPGPERRSASPRCSRPMTSITPPTATLPITLKPTTSSRFPRTTTNRARPILTSSKLCGNASSRRPVR